MTFSEVFGHLRIGGHGIPQKVDMQIEYPEPESYIEIGASIGMDWVK